MKKFLLYLVKPKGASAKWLVFLLLAGVVALWSSGHFVVIKDYLDTPDLTLAIGSLKISPYIVLKATLFVALIFWTTAILSEFVDNRIKKMRRVRAANRALLQKFTQIGFYAIAGLLTLDVFGIDLTSLTVLGGAVGIGLGFGLQKIASNFVSGVILLMERSLKPDDLVELADGTFGYVRRSTSRATLLETFDGKEILVPNEEFITKPVVNWTLSNRQARVDIPFGVSYGTDIHKVQKLALDAAKENKRCMKKPEPTCWLRNFGESSVDFILVFWVEDITEGRWNAQSEVMFSLWDKFKEHNIEIPFPQRDLHIKNMPVLETPKPVKGKKGD
jgi:small-conductance mechanosensitive channel